MFSSVEKEDAALLLANLSDMKQIHKHFELHDLSVRIFFHIRHQAVHRVDMTAYVRPGGIDDNVDRVRTIFVDKYGRRIAIPAPTECSKMWNAHNLQFPIPFHCKRTPESDQKEVYADGRKVPQHCPSANGSGDLVLSKEIETDPRLRIQANYCGRDWIHSGHGPHQQ